jgi:two-component system, CAI-1 autoinducer sensor kinase/phosphatase CqsS
MKTIMGKKIAEESKDNIKVINFIKLMAGSMAHELRTPFGAISIQMDSLKTSFDQQKPLPDIETDFRETYIKIKKVIKSGMHTIKDMLVKLGAFAAGKLPEINYKKQSINENIKDFLSSFPFSEENKKLITVIADREFIYLGDAALTEHVLANLVKNACDAIRSNSSQGAITIELKTGKKYNQLIMRDTGTGIPQELLPKIFDMFETKKSMSGGTGLGLAFCKMVMESYGGTIICNSELGKYTEVVLSFPKIK